MAISDFRDDTIGENVWKTWLLRMLPVGIRWLPNCNQNDLFIQTWLTICFIYFKNLLEIKVFLNILNWRWRITDFFLEQKHNFLSSRTTKLTMYLPFLHLTESPHNYFWMTNILFYLAFFLKIFQNCFFVPFRFWSSIFDTISFSLFNFKCRRCPSLRYDIFVLTFYQTVVIYFLF